MVMSFYQMDPPDPDPEGQPDHEERCPSCQAREGEACQSWCQCVWCQREKGDEGGGEAA